ncbi:inter-alpha-trypsin inhibitor-like isoform X2 [Apostichopus japonicus]|uniref:inter-alpha-trypsin inhibitor-like isoform X2 n=1 Tax=Stichopus japonicus TaxID=307972 RepID=UPI003AB8BCD6
MKVSCLLMLVVLLSASLGANATVPVCSLPVDKGPCLAYFPQWAYEDGSCIEFIYGGCLGNGNKFSSEDECIEACVMPEVPVCSLPVDQGPCLGYFPQWAYEDGSCIEFIYGGCMGNGNKFSSEDECTKACVM